MKVEYTQIKDIIYTENDQDNPLKWVGLKKEDDDSFVNTTNVFICKDYLNDAVYTKHSGHSIYIYGMKSDAFSLCPDGGLYLLLLEVEDSLAHNIQEVLNPYLMRTLGAAVNYTALPYTVLGEKAGVLYLPSGALTSTFHVSLIAGLIRNANVKTKYASFDDFFTPEVARDLHIDDARYLMIKEGDFSCLPLDDYYWYSTTEYNSKIMFTIASYDTYTIHDNGIMGYSYEFIRDSKYGKHMDYFRIVGVDEEEDEEECWDEEEEYEE